MLSVAVSPYSAALAVPCLLAVIWTALRLQMEYRLSKNPGVKAPVMANNLFRGTW